GRFSHLTGKAICPIPAEPIHRSKQGAMTQSIIMSVFFTIKQRGLSLVEVVKKALQQYILTGQLSKLSECTAPNGKNV
ncbi:MAG: hypothetical protein JXB18_09730, partial [Sedimentisphaerales bacterium]|nr:hypothetical protein [Sedimentisphaerales bacterium]